MGKKVRDWKDLPEDDCELPEETDDDSEALPRLTAEQKLVRAIDGALESLSVKIQNEGLKVTDLVKLLQIRKELAGSKPRNVTVQWIGECDETTPLED